eukprot:XP_011667084.1 PREDICTED: uncharacterized protein LOC105439605 [Strongylocentrotus purpuratus]
MVMLHATYDTPGINIQGHLINNLRFADDIVLLACNEIDLQSIVDCVQQWSSNFGLKINIAKTEVQVISKQQQDINISIGGTKLLQVEKFVYLGDFTTIHQALPTIPSQADIVHQKTSLFKRIEGWCLQNHKIKTKHGLSLVKCGAECNKRDDCVSFNIGKGVCELNNQVVGGTGVRRDDFVEDEGFKYYEKQETLS